MKGDIVALVRSIVHGGHGPDFESSLDFGRVIDQELQSNNILTFPDVDREGSVSNG